MPSGLPMIELLRQRIGEVSSRAFQVGSYVGTDHMTKVLTAVRKNFDTADVGGPTSGRTITEAVAAFRTTGRLLSFIDAKYVCIGLSHYLPDDWRLIDSPEMFAVMLDQVRQTDTRPRMFLKCYQGLLYNYFNFTMHMEDPAGEWAVNWPVLRAFLKTELKTVLQAHTPPSWLKTLAAHENLLGENPCRRYGNVLAEGGQKEFRSICEEVGILSGSWILEEAVFAQIEAICGLADDHFANKLDDVVLLLVGQGRSSYSKPLVVRCLAALAIRYVRSREHPDHRKLRDALITYIGNPWLNKPAWNVSVNDEPARCMVDSWLKRHLIHDFFTLLSTDGASDQRRLGYWLKFDKEIEDLWFVLGRDARSNSSKEFRQIRELAKDHLLYLEGGVASNNAFIMKIGDKYAVEFGVTGNACYIFDANRLPFDLTRGQRCFNVTDLKSRHHGQQMIHKDGHQTWEKTFDDYLSRRIGWRPVTTTPLYSNQTSRSQYTYDRISNLHNQGVEAPKPLSVEGYREVWQMATARLYDITDDRNREGYLWVAAPNTVASVNTVLQRHGFRYRPGKGWYRE